MMPNSTAFHLHFLLEHVYEIRRVCFGTFVKKNNKKCNKINVNSTHIFVLFNFVIAYYNDCENNCTWTHLCSADTLL